MQVIPVAGYDSMLMTLSGCHAPAFTRNLVILEDSAGHQGIGEIHGGDYTCECLNAVKPLVEGQPIAKYRQILQKIHKLANPAAEDDGEGIAPELLPHIFDRFFSTRKGGAGVGLALTKEIVSLHRGTVRASNDGGAVFEIILPIG